MDETLTVEFDGGSRGNPGPGGIGFVVRAADGTPLITVGRFIGVCTNNVAEYKALIGGLEAARALGAKKIAVRGDSELIIKQMRGEYRVKHPDLKPLHASAERLMGQFEHASISHTLRHKNELADKLANLAMDRRGEVTDAEDDAGAAAIAERREEAAKAGDACHCARCGCHIVVKKPSGIRPHQMKPFVCQCGAKMHKV
jgi:ribonuclease HI